MLDLLFVSKILETGNIGLLDYDFLLQDNLAGQIAAYCKNYLERHQKLPSKSVVEAEFANILPENKLPSAPQLELDNLLNGLRNRYVYLQFKQLIRQADSICDQVGADKPFEALEYLEKSITDLRKRVIGRGDIISLSSLADVVRREYEAAKTGSYGLEFPFKTMNDYIGGLRGGELLTVVARLSVGKSWFLIRLAHYFWRQGLRVLFVPTEMPAIRVAMRFVSLEAGVSYDRLRRGTLDIAFENKNKEKVFYELINALQQQKDIGFWIAGHGFDVKVSSVDIAVRQTRPDIVFIDGLYLLRHGGYADRYEKAASAAEAVKQLALQHDLPIIVSTQFNREVKPDKLHTVRVENIGLTDVIGWVSDFIIALYRDSEMRQRNEMKVIILKSREGEAAEFDLKWMFGDNGFECYEEGQQLYDDRRHAKEYVEEFEGGQEIKDVSSAIKIAQDIGELNVSDFVGVSLDAAIENVEDKEDIEDNEAGSNEEKSTTDEGIDELLSDLDNSVGVRRPKGR